MDDSAKHPAPNASRVREIGDSPFCWQHKVALRKIRESFDAEKAVASAIGVYNALTEIASDEQMEIFTTTHAWIAQKSGLSPRTVHNRLTGLAEIGLVEISTPIMKAPSTYRLLAVTQPLQNDTQPLQSVLQRTKKAPLQSLEESIEESPEESLKKKSADLLFEISIPKRLNKPEFLTVWKDWLDHRSKIRKPLNDLSAKKELEKLSGWESKHGLEKIIAAVNAAIAAGSPWIYEPKAKFQKSDDDNQNGVPF